MSSSSLILRPLHHHGRHFVTPRSRISTVFPSRATFSCRISSASSSSSRPFRHIFLQKPRTSFSHSHAAKPQHIWHSNIGIKSCTAKDILVPEGTEMAVILLGWLGAEQRHLRRYAEWYNSRGIHAITFVLPMSDILSFNAIPKSEQHVENLYRDITRWVSQENGKSRSLLFHTFSNTGWFTYGELLENFLKRETSLLSRIEGCVVDSGPAAELNPQVWASGFVTAFLKKQSFSVQPISIAPRPKMSEVFVLAAVEKFFALLLAVPALKERLSRVISILSTKQPNCPQLYIYSSADKVIPASYVQSFMAEQKQRGYKVSSCDMQLSPHVDHFRTYPELYSQQLQTFIKQCLEKDPLKKMQKQTADC